MKRLDWSGPNYNPVKYETRPLSGSNYSAKPKDYYSAVHNIYPDASDDNSMGDSVMWETHYVTLAKTTPYGFGIAVSGGRDNPHFSSGDPSIAISDVLKGGPADGRLFINDRVLFVNSVSLENVDYATAISVLKDCGDTVHLVVRRKASPISHCTETILTRPIQSSMSWGVIIGCKLFVSRILPNSIASIDQNIQEGDVIMAINGHKSSHLSLAEAQKLIDRCKENNLKLSISKYEREILNRSLQSDKTPDNLISSSPLRNTHENTPPRPPLPSYIDTNCDNIPVKRPNDIDLSPKCRVSHIDCQQRHVEFKKGTNGLGIRVSGGNRTGVFVAAVTHGAAAYGQLYEGDVLLNVNGMDLSGRTREEVVMTLMNLRDRVELKVEYRKNEFERLMKDGGSGDSFYVRSHFDYDEPDQDCLQFKNCDIFHVTDTLYNGVPGYWCVRKVSKSNSNNESVHIGIIPNLENARKYVAKQKEIIQLAEDKENKKGNFFRKRAKRSKSLSKDQWEEMIFINPTTKFDVYERVIPKEPGFIRPVIIFGPLADVAREHLQKDIRVYQSPQSEQNEGSRSAIIKLGSIRKVIQMNKHCVLDITPSAVDRLQYAQYAPIVIYLKAASKATVKHLRNQYAKRSRKSAKSLFEQSQKLEKLCSHLFTDIIFLEGANWLDRIKDSVDRQQEKAVWMMHETNDKSEPDDEFFFPMTTDNGRFSYASGPEDVVDIDAVWNNAIINEHEHVSPTSQYHIKHKQQRVFGRRTTNAIYRTSSDPSLNAADRIPGIPPYPDPPAYFMHKPNVPPLPTKIGRSKDVEVPLNPNINDPQINGEPIYSRIQARKYDVVQQNPSAYDKGFSSLNSVKDPRLMYQSQVELDEYLANQQDDVKLRVRKANHQPLSPVTTSGYTSDDQKLNRRDPNLPNHGIYEQTQSVSSQRPRTEYITDKKSFDKYKIRERPLSHYSDRDRSTFNYQQTRSSKMENQHVSTTEGNYGRLNDYRSIGDKVTNIENPLYANGHDLRSRLDNNIYSTRSTSTFRPNNQQQYMPRDSQQAPPKPPVGKKPIIAPRFYAKSSNGVPLIQRDRLQSEDGDHQVVATASGIFGYNGGILESPETGVSIIIPKGAIREGREQNIYFKVCKDNSLLPPLDKEKGETLLSPLVMCGPHGLKFDQPVELRLPHCASVNPDSWAFALKSSDSATGQTSKWQDVQLNDDAISHRNGGVVGKNSVSVLVDHF